MTIRTYKVTLDTKNTIAPEPVYLRQGDKTGAVVIDATLMDNGAPVSLDGLTPMFKANTADGQAVIADSTGFNITNKLGGEFTYQVPSQLGSVDGKIKIAYFSFSDSSGAQSTFNVVFVVEKAVDMTQEHAKDWVSNLNEIIDQYNQWVNSAHSSWAEFVDSNKEIIESIDPGGTLLTEVIDARVAEDGTVYPTLKNRLDEHGNKYLFEPVGEFEGVEDVFVPGLSEIVSKIDSAKFNVGMITDNHYDYGGKISRPWSNKMLRHLSNINSISAKLDLIVHGGDNSNSGVIWSVDPTLRTMKKMYSQYVTKAVEADCDVLFAIGNHDDGSILKSTLGINPTLSQILTEQDFKNLTYTKELLANETRANDSLYCFKDYPDKKIRVIILNSADTPEDAVNSDGTQKYLRQWTLGYRQEQLGWLINTALVVPKEYHTIIFSHVNLNETPTYYGDVKETHFNHNVLENIIKAFIAGSTYVDEQTYSDAPEFNTSISADFSMQGPRVFVGWFNGHSHREHIDDRGVFKVIHCINSVNLTADLMYTENEDGWTVLSVDTVNRHVDLFGFGRATDRSIDY